MKFKGSTSGETSRSQKATHCTIPFIPRTASGKTGNRKQMDGQSGVGEREVRPHILEADDNTPKSDCAVVT